MRYPFQDPSLSLEARVDDLVGRLTLSEKLNMLSTYQRGVPRLGIEDWHIGGEVARGYVSRDPEVTTTVLPQPIGMSAMFDPELIEKLGEIAGIEARILHSKNPRANLMLWGPTVDACRDPRWGRNEESYGEDPFLTGSMSAAYTRGMAGTDPRYMRTIPTLKHFFADNNEENRASCDANLEPRTKYEYYHEFFRHAIEEGGARSMMASYNSLSGAPAIVNPEIQSIVKDEWGLDFVVTDGGDFTQNVTAHHYSESHAETFALATKAGTDIMTDGAETVAIAAREALEQGLVTEEDINRTLKCSLRARFKLGEFDPKGSCPYSEVDPAKMDCPEHRSINHRAALEQIVLLKNDGILPLDKGTKIALIGDLGGRYCMDWYTGYSAYHITPLEGLRSEFGGVAYDDGHDRVAIRSLKNGKFLSVTPEGTLCACADSPDERSTFIKADWGGEVTYKAVFSNKFFTTETMKADSDTAYRWFNQEILRPQITPDGITYLTYFKDSVLGISEDGSVVKAPIRTPRPETLFEEIVISDGAERVKKLSKDADAVIVCAGNDPMIIARECYDRTVLGLPPHQTKLIKAAKSANENTLLVMISSYPYAVSEEENLVRAAVWSSHAGPELGSALAEALSGKYNPAGRLPQTWYVSEDELPDIKDYDIIKNNMTYLFYQGRPIHPFGYGLSYSKFEYSGLTLKRVKNGTAVSFDVKNVSETDGEEVAQVYFKAVKPSVKRPLKQLCGFRRVFVPAGKTAHIEITVDDKNLRFYDVSREKFCVETGEYEFSAGASSADIRLCGTVRVAGEKVPPRDLSKTTKAINYDDKSGTRMRFAKHLSRHYMQNGTLIYKNVRLSGEKTLQLLYATSGMGAKVRMWCDGEQICEHRLEGTACPTEFRYKEVPIKPRRGLHDIAIQIDGISLLEFILA